MITRGDRILIFLLIISSLTVLLFFNFYLFRADASDVVIEVNGKLYAQYSLKELHKPKQVMIETEYGYNLLLLEKGNVSVLESSCKDKLEVQSGTINHAGQQLICLPNRLVIRLKGKSEQIDGVTY